MPELSLNLQPVQSRSHPTTNYENVFADELEGVYGQGVHDLAGVVTALNGTGVRPPDGEDWTEQSLTAELARLGRKETVR